MKQILMRIERVADILEREDNNYHTQLRAAEIKALVRSALSQLQDPLENGK